MRAASEMDERSQPASSYTNVFQTMVENVCQKRCSLLKNSYMDELYLLYVLFSRSDFGEKMRSE